MNNRKIDIKKTKQIVIDAGLHKELKMKAAAQKITIKGLVEAYLAELLAR